jgi:hypothetical protein
MARKDDRYILAACGEAGARQPEHLHLSRARPGTRAPHMLLERKGKRLCTCCLFGEHFVLLTGVDESRRTRMPCGTPYTYDPAGRVQQLSARTAP